MLSRCSPQVDAARIEQARAAKPVREYAAILFSYSTDAAIVFPADQPVQLADRIRLAELWRRIGWDLLLFIR